MESKFYEGNILDSMEFIYGCGKEGNKVIFSGMKNVPLTRSMYYIFYRNGKKDCFQSWQQFIEVLYDLGREHVEVNLQKVKDSFSVYLPNFMENEVVIEYYGNKIEQEDGVVLGETLTYSDCVKAKTDMKAQDFKEWLSDRVTECGIDYNVDMEVGVNKHMRQLKEILK